MFKEFEVVTLLEDVSQGGNAAKAGEIGTIVHIYPEVDAFTVEFNPWCSVRGRYIGSAATSG